MKDQMSLRPLVLTDVLSGWLSRMIAAGLTLLVIAAYFPVLENRFVNWDDNGYVTENPMVRGGFSREALYYAWTTFDVGNWIPVTWMSYQLDATLFGVNSAAFHGVNVLLHAINVVLLFTVLRRMTDCLWRSAAVAAIFAVHPLHVESVAWVSERKDLLSTGALLLVLLLYERYSRQPSFRKMLGIVVVYSLGLLSKSMIVTAPVLLLILDYWPLDRWSRTAGGERITDNTRFRPARTGLQLLREKLPLCVCAGIACIMAVAAQWQPAVISTHAASLSGRIMNAFDACRWYLQATFWPLNLSAFYPHPGTTDLQWLKTAWPRCLVSALLILILSLLITFRPLKHRIFGWAWFLISLLPVIGLIQVGSQAYADRYTYIPHIGLFVLLVWEMHTLLSETLTGRRTAVLLATILILACTGLTQAQVRTWKDTESLWKNAVDVDSSNLFAHLQLGIELCQQERFREARGHLSEALLLFPDLEPAILYLGALHGATGDELTARAYFEWLIRVNPNNLQAQRTLEVLYQSHPPQVPRAVSEAVLQELKQGMQKTNRSTRQYDWAAALTHYERALVLDSGYVPSMRLAARALEELERFAEARKYYEGALRLDRRDVEALHALERLDRRKSRSP